MTKEYYIELINQIKFSDTFLDTKEETFILLKSKISADLKLDDGHWKELMNEIDMQLQLIEMIDQIFEKKGF